MKNYKGDGTTFEFTGVAKNAGDGVLQGKFFGICTKTVASTEVGVATLKGRFEVPKLSTDNMSTVGAYVYWDNANSRVQLTQIAGALAGKVAKVAGATTTKVEIVLVGAADV